MMYGVDVEALEGTDPVYTVAEEVFAAMVDGEPGHLVVRHGPPPSLVDPVHAWVDVHGLVEGRVLLSTEELTAHRITRALLGKGPEESVDDGDMVDALGEMANVVGGNLRALASGGGSMALPEVGAEPPVDDTNSLVHEVLASWRGRPFVISVWVGPE